MRTEATGESGVPLKAHRDTLSSFHPAIEKWFRTELGTPSEPQQRAWPEIARRNNVLIVAPTGSGKTLAAFLQCVNALIHEKSEAPPTHWTPGVRVLYVSPLKALNNDIYRNLEVPLTGIKQVAERTGVTLPEITKAVRTGDTSSSERQRMVRRPPDILITTPESLYLLLTSAKAREMLRTVQYVIADEIHSICGTKRGVHLALSLERVCELTRSDPVRIGLSATVRPPELAAAFLCGYSGRSTSLVPRDVKIIACSLPKEVDVRVESPVEDYRNLQSGPVWTDICEDILEMVRSHRSTLVFVNNRRAAEMVAAGINNLAGEDIAKSHHGSISKEARHRIEELLKRGELPCLVATSSLELGIDIGAIDLVVQIESPSTIAQVVQRIGRAGHRLDAVSKGVIMTKTRGDLLKCAFANAQVGLGYLEELVVPESPLDVLAQQIVAAISVREYTLEELYILVRRAYPYRSLSLDHLEAVLAALSNPDEPGRAVSGVSRPRIVWDAINDRIRATPLGKMLALSHSGTIIDRGYYQVYLAGSDVKLGELDEEFVYESRRGHKFTLGTSAWRIERIERDRVLVSQTSGEGARLPFWKGEGLGRTRETGFRLGRFIATLQEKVESGEYEEWINSTCRVSRRVADNLRHYVEDQIAVTGALPTDRRIVIEHFSDEAGEKRVLIHCPLGTRINAGLGLFYTEIVKESLGCAAEYMCNDDGVLVHVFDKSVDLTGIFFHASASESRNMILDLLPKTSAFMMSFRHCASRALMLTRPGVASRRRRFPLWMQRLRGAELFEKASTSVDHPIVLEAYKECMDTAFDIDGLVATLEAIQNGRIELREVTTLFPSPFGSELLFRFFGAYMYIGDLPRAEQRGSALVSDFSVFGAPSRTVEYESIDPRALEDLKSSRVRDVVGVVRGPDEVHRALRVLGPIPSQTFGLQDIAKMIRIDDEQSGEMKLESDRLLLLENMLEQLAAEGRASQIRLDGWSQPRWVASEDVATIDSAVRGDTAGCTDVEEDVSPATIAVDALIRRFISVSLPFTMSDLTRVYPVSTTTAIDIIEGLWESGELISVEHWEGTAESRWCSTSLYERLRVLTLQYAKKDMEPKQPEAFCRFLFDRHRVQPEAQDLHLTHVTSESVRQVIEGPGELDVQSNLSRLEHAIKMVGGVFLPAPWWEDFILPSRVRSYSFYHLDMLCASGKVRWVGRTRGSTHELAIFHSDDFYSMYASESVDSEDHPEPDEDKVLEAVRAAGSPSITDLTKITSLSLSRVWAALEGLVWRGQVSSSEFMPARLLSHSDSTNTVLSRPHLLARTGRWSVVGSITSIRADTETVIEAVSARILRRYGLVCKETFEAECSEIPWSEAYRYLDRKEMAGEYVRGYFVSCLSGIQFSKREIVDELRSYTAEQDTSGTHNHRDRTWVVLVTGDPALPYRSVFPLCPSNLSWTRSQSSAVVLCNGEAVLLATRYGSSLHPAENMDTETMIDAVEQLTVAFQKGRLWVGHSGMTVRSIGPCPVDGMDPLLIKRMSQMGYQSDYDGLTVWRIH